MARSSLLEHFERRQVKRLVNSSKNFVLLMINPKADINDESFEGCDPKLK